MSASWAHQSTSAHLPRLQLLLLNNGLKRTLPPGLHVLCPQLTRNKLVHAWDAVTLSLPSCGKQLSVWLGCLSSPHEQHSGRFYIPAMGAKGSAPSKLAEGGARP